MSKKIVDVIKSAIDQSKTVINNSEEFKGLMNILNATSANCPYREAKCPDTDCECAKLKAFKKMQEPGVIEKTLEDLGFDANMDAWNLLMGMQKKFAAKFHKVDDLTKTEKDHWINEYLVCIEDEVREVREYLNIYPTPFEVGNSKNNVEELKKEVIDIWHFVMDTFICGGATGEMIKKAYLVKYAPNVVDTVDFLKFVFDNQFASLHLAYGNYDLDSTVLLLVNKLLDCNGAVRQQISWKHWKKPTDTIDEEKLFDAFADMFKVLIDLSVLLIGNANEVKNIYIKKNVENILRQQEGY